MEIIKWFDLPKFEQTIILDNNAYVFSAFWNSRSEKWSISLTNNDNVTLLNNKQLTLNVNLLNYIYVENSPKGVLFAANIPYNVEKINRDNIGVTIQIVYLTQDEIENVV